MTPTMVSLLLLYTLINRTLLRIWENLIYFFKLQHLLTHCMQQSLVKKLIVAQLVRKFSTFYWRRRLISVIPKLSQMHEVHTFPPYFPKIHSNVIFSCLPFRFSDHTLYAFGILIKDEIKCELYRLKLQIHVHFNSLQWIEHTIIFRHLEHICHPFSWGGLNVNMIFVCIFFGNEISQILIGGF
jgi:hypothetical protein